MHQASVPPAAPLRSTVLRKQGNAKYASAWDTRGPAEGMAPALRIYRCQEATALYQQAKTAAGKESRQDEWASANKNLGMCHLSLLRLSATGASVGTPEKLLWHCESALTCFCENLKATAKPAAWRAAQYPLAREVVAFANEHLVLTPLSDGGLWQQGAALLEMLGRVIATQGGRHCSPVGAFCSLALAELLTKQGVRSDEKGAFRESKLMMETARQPCIAVAEALRGCTAAAVGEEAAVWADVMHVQLDDVEQRRIAHLARGEAQLWIGRGNQAVEELLLGDDDLGRGLESGLIDHVLDCFRQAMLTAREETAALECEAEATSLLANIIGGMLKAHASAELLYKQVIQLGEAMRLGGDGRNLFDQPWYVHAKAEIEKYRTQRILRDSAELQKVRAPTLAKLKPELDAMSAAEAKAESPRYKAWELLNHVYNNHPSKRPAKKKEAAPAAEGAEGAEAAAPLFTLPRTAEKAEIRKALVRASLCYHPDKNMEWGVEWCILCEEIQKRINFYTTELKGLE